MEKENFKNKPESILTETNDTFNIRKFEELAGFGVPVLLLTLLQGFSQKENTSYPPFKSPEPLHTKSLSPESILEKDTLISYPEKLSFERIDTTHRPLSFGVGENLDNASAMVRVLPLDSSITSENIDLKNSSVKTIIALHLADFPNPFNQPLDSIITKESIEKALHGNGFAWGFSKVTIERQYTGEVVKRQKGEESFGFDISLKASDAPLRYPEDSHFTIEDFKIMNLAGELYVCVKVSIPIPNRFRKSGQWINSASNKEIIENLLYWLQEAPQQDTVVAASGMTRAAPNIQPYSPLNVRDIENPFYYNWMLQKGPQLTSQFELDLALTGLPDDFTYTPPLDTTRTDTTSPQPPDSTTNTPEIPEGYRLLAYPNPGRAGESVKVIAHLSEPGTYRLTLFNIMGQIVAEYEYQIELKDGTHIFALNTQDLGSGNALPPGVYFVRLQDVETGTLRIQTSFTLLPARR